MGSTCVRCTVPGCIKCDGNPSICLECGPNFTKIDNSCYCDNPDPVAVANGIGLFFDNNRDKFPKTCDLCADNCTRCNSAWECNTCATGYTNNRIR